MNYLADICCIVGVLLIGGGCWLYDPPAAMVVVGAILLGISVRAATK